MKLNVISRTTLIAAGALSIAASAHCNASALAADITIVHAGRLLADPSGNVTEQQSVIIKDGVVSAIMPGYVTASAAGATNADEIQIHDLKNMFVLPGLIDSHVHITSENNPRGRLQSVQMSDPDRAITAAGFARKTLMAGFTTVRDVGALARVSFHQAQPFL